MEYIRVKLSKEPPAETIPVMIDGENNGIVGNVIEIDDGTYDITADTPGAELKEVTIEYGGSTVEEPQEVLINVT